MLTRINSFFRRHDFASRHAAVSAIIALIVVWCAPAHAQAPMKEVHDDIVLKTADNVDIHITYFQSDLGKETPVVILLHAEGSSRQAWISKGGFAEKLWNNGYAVIAVDLRKHGQSVIEGPGVRPETTPGDRQRMVTHDLEAVKEFIFKEHMAERLNMNKTGIIAPEMSAAVAILYTMLDWRKAPFDDGRPRTPRGQDIRTLILLSPESNPKGLTLGANLVDVGKLAAIDPTKNPELEFSMLFLYGTADKKDRRGETKRMHNKTSKPKGADKSVLIHGYPYKYRGLELIGANNIRTKCEEHMLGFLGDHLKKLSKTEWIDRRSRFNRN